MFVDTNLSAVSTWMTYFVQIALGYLTTRGLCALIPSPRIRLRLWGCFLFLTIAGWTIFGVHVSAGNSVPLTTGSLHVVGNRGQWGFWPVSGSWAGHLAWVGPWTWRLYLSIVIIFMLQLLWKSLRLRSFLRTGQAPSEEVGLLFKRLCREMKVSRCDLILLGDLRSPATVCWWQPHVLLPTELVPFLDGGQLADVLRHELIHVRCRHYLWDRLAALGCRLVFFHPAVWFAHRRMRQERELACDLAVVQNGEDRRLRYAECLVKLARWWFLARRNSPDAIGFSSSESLLSARVRALLRETSPCSGFQQAARNGVVAVVATTAVCFLPSIGVTLYQSRPWASVVTPPQHDGATRRKHVAGTDRESRMPTRKQLYSEVSLEPRLPLVQNGAMSQPAALLERLSSRALPVLGNPSTGASHASEADSTPALTGNDRSGSVALHPVWDESPMPRPSTAAPNWQKATIDAINIGVNLATGGGESPDGQVEQQGNHR
jgi:beta-lactamase regulating signal transducer with metallopeptidase domain